MRVTIGAVLLGAMLAVMHAQSVPSGRGDGLITVDAIVEGPDQRPVSDLRQEDFEVVADGQQRPIQSFARDAESLTLVLLVDLTNSLTGAGVSGRFVQMRDSAFGLSAGELRNAAERFLERLVPGDRARVGAITGRLSLSPSFTSDPRELAKAARAELDRTERERHGPSPIWDAVDAAVTALQGEAGRRTIVLFTDGKASGDRIGMGEAADHAVAAGVNVNIVAPFQSPPIPQDRGAILVRPDRSLGAVADVTGGVLISQVEAKERKPNLLLTTVLPRLRTAYRLGFAPAARDGKLHRLEVRVKKEGLTVRARKGHVETR